MMQVKAPSQTINATIELSGSKSISNRLLVLKDVLDLPTQLLNLSNSEDTHLLQKALNQSSQKKEAIIDVNHAGTALRFLTAYLAIKPGNWTLTGSQRLCERPIGNLADALVKAGAQIEYINHRGYPPLKIIGTHLSQNKITIDANVSSQFISALLLIAPGLPDGLQIQLNGTVVSEPYIEMTIALLKQFGVTVIKTNTTITVPPFKNDKALAAFTIEPDWSSASYWYSICALSPGSTITLPFFTSNSLQGDSILVKLFEPLGVQSTFKNGGLQLKHTGNNLSAFEYDFSNCPDIAQTLAVTCFGLGIKATLNGLQTLPLKETNRIQALKNEFEKLGATVHADSSSLRLLPGKLSHHATIETYNDHRMAMSFAPLAMLLQNLVIKNHNVVSKSYPDFWNHLKEAGFDLHLQA